MPTTFITYSHDSDAHKAKTLALSNRLREQGIDVTIDAYVPHPPEGWPKWMEHQFQAEFVIVVLSPRYIREFNQEVASNSGARYEGAMLSALLHGRGVSYEKIAVVCFDGWDAMDIPLILKGCTRYFVDRPGEYENLYAFLTGQMLVQKPPLGNVVQLRPMAHVQPMAFPANAGLSFQSLCKAIWPLMEENGRIFLDFGPNSGAAQPGEVDREVRFDLAIWNQKRRVIGVNNLSIGELIRANMDVIPVAHAAVFRKWLSHIDAFALHLDDKNLDYRHHQFPREVVDIIKGEL